MSSHRISQMGMTEEEEAKEDRLISSTTGPLVDIIQSTLLN